MNNQLQKVLHQSLQGINPTRAGASGHLVKRVPPVRDTKAAEPTAKQKRAKRRARKQARRR